MSISLRSIYKNVINNRDLHNSIPDFLNITTDIYNTTATVRLALDYYIFYEKYLDEKDNWDGQLHEFTKSINSLISEAVVLRSNIKETENYVSLADGIRRNITERMELLSSYADTFEVYEYAINRVEYRFKDFEELEDDEEFAREVLRYIFEEEDNVIINDRIKDIIGQLPVRIAKKKYFDYIMGSLGELVGAQRDIFESYIYMIRSRAMLDITEEKKDMFPSLWEKKEKLERLNFKDINKEQYEDAELLIREALVYLETEITAYYSLIEIVNELYALLICCPYICTETLEDKELKEAADKIISSVNTAFLTDRQEEPSKELVDSLGVLEGYQEDMEHDLISIDDALYHIDSNHRIVADSLGKQKMLDALLLCKNLLSGSHFVDLEKTISDEVIDMEGLKKEVDKLIMELTDRFKSTDRMITRAIMANTMELIPVYFNTHTEVMEYVLYSLNRCTDIAEKYASMEIIQGFMEA